MSAKKVVLLGSTGSIGSSTLSVAREVPERLELVGLAAANSVAKLAEQVAETGVKHVGIYNAEKEAELRGLVPDDVEIYVGLEGLIELAKLEGADMVLVAIVGTAGLQPTFAAIEAGKDIAVASKEILVMAGELVMEAAREKGVNVLPVDSEHNAIFQCLSGETREVSRLILTASGGPFRTWEKEKLNDVTLEQALKHPTWEMGRKITIDIVHPQSIVHSMVEYIDGSVIAQLSNTDMCFPIQYAVTWPERVPNKLKSLDFAALGKLEFEAPRREDFPAIDLAVRAGTEGGTLPAVFNAANEVAVDAFIAGKIGFTDIWKVVEMTMDRHVWGAGKSLTELIAADGDARAIAGEVIANDV